MKNHVLFFEVFEKIYKVGRHTVYVDLMLFFKLLHDDWFFWFTIFTYVSMNLQ